MLQHAIYEALQRFGEKGMRKDSAATRDWTPVEMMKLLRLDPAVAAHPLAIEEHCKGNTFFFKETRKAVDGLFGVTQQAGGSKKGNAERRSHLNVTKPAQLLWTDLQVCGRPRNTLFAPPALLSAASTCLSAQETTARFVAGAGRVVRRVHQDQDFLGFLRPGPASTLSLPPLHTLPLLPFLHASSPLKSVPATSHHSSPPLSPAHNSLTLSLFLKSSADHGRVTLDRRAPDQAGVCVARRTATAARKIPLRFHPSTVAPNAKPRPLRAHSFSARFALHGPSPARG